MRLSGGTADLGAPDDVAEALRTARERLGHRPAVTVLRPDGREEQGFVSLARWAAKGAHLLGTECGLRPGDRLHLAATAGWTAAAVAYAAWWLGVAVTDGDAPVAVVDERADPPHADHVFRVGAAPDGAPIGATREEPWPSAVQAFPDAPPTPGASPDAVAVELGTVEAGAVRLDHRELLATADRWDADGALGLAADAAAAVWLPALARPLVTGHPTVVLDGVGEEAASAEGIAVWT